jgi:hypothetical protein
MKEERTIYNQIKDIQVEICRQPLKTCHLCETLKPQDKIPFLHFNLMT